MALDSMLYSFLTNEYRDEVEKAILGKSDRLIVDFLDLPVEVRESLHEDYYRYKTGSSSLDVIIAGAFNTISRELDVERGYKEGDLSLLFRNVYPKLRLREIGSDELNGLFQLNGTITSVTKPMAFMKVAAWECGECRETVTVEQTTTTRVKPPKCLFCGSGTKPFTLVEELSKYDDYQEIMIQENPDEVKAGVVPRTMRGRVVGKQLIDICKPGNEVNVVGTLITREARSKDKRVFETLLDVNNIEVLTLEASEVKLSDEDISQLRDYATDPNIENILIDSIFPKLHGWDQVKQGLVYSVFGGVDMRREGVRRRGTINVLMVGDPGTGKTQMLLCIADVAPKAMYTDGKGASGVGLTAAVINDPVVGWTLQGGAVVLTDNGTCCVDEIDKMREDDRNKLHQCMSTQTVSVNKATIHATLNARTNIIAAGNPVDGRYDSSLLITDNIDLPVTILDRFDLIYIMKDVPDEETDTGIVNVVLDDGEREKETIPVDFIKKYILHAKLIEPKLSEGAKDAIREYYVGLRGRSRTTENTPIAITVRQVEGIKRLGQARARIRLSDTITKEDAEVVISLMEDTLKDIGIDPITGDRDIGARSGKPKSTVDRRKFVADSLKAMNSQVFTEVFIVLMEESGFTKEEVREIFRYWEPKGIMIQPRDGIWIHRDNLAEYRG